MGLIDKFKELSDTIGSDEHNVQPIEPVRPLEDAPITELDPVLMRHLARLEQEIYKIDDIERLEEADPSVMTATGEAVSGAGRILGSAAKGASTAIGGSIAGPLGAVGGALAGLLVLFGAKSFIRKWYKDKTALLKKFDPDDFERVFEERIRPTLKEFLEDIIMEKFTDKMPPEWWVSFSRRHAIKRRVAEKMDMVISREVAPIVQKALSDAFNRNRSLMEKELKLMIMRQGERPAGKPRLGWGAEPKSSKSES